MDLEEMNLKWQVAMLSVNIKRFENKTGIKFGFRGRDPARLTEGRSSAFLVVRWVTFQESARIGRLMRRLGNLPISRIKGKLEPPKLDLPKLW